MKKRLISILILVAMLFTLLPAQALTGVADNVTTAGNTVRENMEPENPFTDVLEGSWYYDAVQYAYINGFFNGTDLNTFNPDGTMDRAMFVTVLGRMAGMDPNAYMGQSAFIDVPADAWYAPYVAWAAKYGITAGVGNDKFDPDGLINREQMAVFFVRYFEVFGVDYDTGANITTVPADIDTVSPWAKGAVLKLWKTGLLTGDGVNFDPAGNASRAQAATLTMRTDRAVETWYSEPGVPSGRVSVEPGAGQTPETPDSSTEDSDGKTDTDSTDNESKAGGSSSGNSTGGSGTGTDDSDSGSKTTYYKVTFVIDTATEEKLYPESTLLSTLPSPAQPSGKVFLGWYYDAEGTKPVTGNARLNANTTLYANFTEAVALDEGGTPNFVSALDKSTDFSVTVKKDGNAPIPGTDFIFRNVTAPDKTPETEVAAEDLINIETVRVEGGNGVWIISSASGGFTPGHTYQIELINDTVTYDDSTDAFGNLKETNERYDIGEVRFFNFSIENTGIMNLKLNDGIKYIPANQLNPADAVGLMEYTGLYLASTDSQGNTTFTANNGSGSFTYTGSEQIQAGDTVAVYSGTRPTERQPEKGSENKTDNDDVSYLKITRVDGSTYHYAAPEAEDVLFMPDVLPVDVDENDGTTGWSENGTSVIIDNRLLDFSDTKYESMGLSSATTVDAGDFLAFFKGDFGDDGAQDQAYGKITVITDNGNGTTTITYEAATQNDVMSAMDLYDETQLSEDTLQDIVDEHKDEIQQIIEAQLMESDFFDDAGEYLAGLALQTDEVREVFGDDLTLTDCIVTYADGTPIGAQDLALMGNIIDNDQDGKKPKFSVSITPRLSHFAQNVAGTGLRVEVAVNYKFKIQKKGNNNIMEVELTAFFEQEFTIGFNVSGGAVWKWKWIFPYIADYRMTGNLDMGTYTGLGITATAKLKEDKEPWGMPWPNSAKEAAAAKKIFSLSESIKKMIKEAEGIIPEAEASASGGLAEKYAAFMEDANEEWVDLVKVTVLDLHGAVDPLHILAYGLQVDFVVSANLNVAIGMTFQYENYKRHSFTLSLLSKKGESNTVDLSANGYQFDFYVMGTMGIRAGIRIKITVGLFSTKLAGIGIQVEAGVYARLWGYFYYHLENWKVNGVWQKESGYSGALLIEIGAYLEVKFIAEALNGKYSYAPTLYSKEWPFWSAGQRENVYDFAYEDDPTYAILNVNTYTLPKNVFDMIWMDLKTGEIEEDLKNKTKNFDSNTAPNGDDEERFVVVMSNPNFTYNPVNNQITINTASGELAQSSNMKITWKGAPLSGSNEVLSRNITLNWSNDKNAGTIAFETNGGSTVPMLRLLAGTTISSRMPAPPTRLGYTFAGWYTNQALTNSFNATTMPAGNTTLYAKWTPNSVSYTVEHYQKALDSQYVLVDTDKTTKGIVGAQTAAVARSYAGFTVQTIKQQTITPDGSTRVAIYYDRNLYDLKFVYGNGSNDVTAKVPYGAAIVKPSNPAKQGYTFTGWSADIPEEMPANALAFTALWTEKTDTPYIVKHNKQSLTGAYVLEQTEGKTGATGQSTEASARTYTGFTVQPFTQKLILPDGSTIVEINYDRNSHTLSWNTNGGNALTGTYTQGNVKYGTPIVKPETPTRAGYTLAGWYTDAELTEVLEDNATMPDMALTLHAEWNAREYTISFNSNDGSAVAPITQDCDTEVKAPAAPTKAGYTFAGWQLNRADYTFTTMPVEDIILTAKWTPNTYTVVFNGNGSDGGSMQSQTFTYDLAQVLTANGFTRANYTFTGWNTAEDGSGTSYANSASVKNLTDEAGGTVTLYAQWNQAASTSYQIWVDGIQVTNLNEGNVLGDGTVQYDSYNQTLILNGINLVYDSSDPVVGSSYNPAAIYASGNLTIELAAGTTNTIINQLSSSSWNCGIYMSSGNLTITGTGALTVTGGTGYTSHGISVGGQLIIENGTVTAVGRTAQGVSGIYASSGITINGGTVTATAGEATAGYSRGLESSKIIINGGTVTATAEKATGYMSYGIDSSTITVNGGTVIAVGEDKAIDLGGTFTVADELNITASTDIDGLLGEYIPANLPNYKRIKVEPQP